MGWNLLGGLMPPAVDTAEEKERRYSEDSGNASQDEEASAVPYNKDLSLEDAILANFPDGCDRSFIVESKDEDSYEIIPKNLTFAEIINILNQAIKEENYEKLDEIIQNIEEYEGRSITLDIVNLKSFCEQQLNLDLRNNQHIYSNILSQYKFDQENFEYHYSVKELVLLAIAADDKLAEKYQDILFAEGNLSLLPLLVGGQEYIKAFIEKFHGIDGVYNKIKDQTIQLVEPNKIGFFSTIALRKEQELLETVLVEHVLRDLEHILKTSNPDPLYGVLETASLVKNEKFIMIVLNAFEKYVNEPTQDLLKGSFVTLLETAISQEHLPIVEYLCKRYVNNKGSTSYDIYEQAFANDRVIKVLNQQILKKIEARSRKEIYDLVLKTALDAGNIEFIEHLCEEYAECSNDVIDYLNQKLESKEFDKAYESALITLSNIKSEDIVIDVIAHIQIYQNIPHNEQVIRQVIQNILRNAVHYSTDQEDYSLIKKVCYLCTESNEISVIFREECETFKSSVKERIEDLEQGNKLLQSEALHEYNYNYLPNAVSGLAQVAHAGYDIYTENQNLTKCQENTDLILNLTHIRNILQFSIDVQEYSCHERQRLWDQMYSTSATFIIRKKSDNIADRSTIPAIESDILSENSESQNTDNQQPQRSIVDKGENIIANKKASKEAISNNYRRGKMLKNIKEKLSYAIDNIDFPGVAKLLAPPDNKVDKPILQKSLNKANNKIKSLKESRKKKNLRLIIKLLTEKLEETVTALSVGDKADCSSTTKPPVMNSTDSQQPQENVVDKGENIINSEKASEEAIGNNDKRGKMLKSTRTIREELSDAIFSLNDEKVRSLVKQVKEENNNVDTRQILSKVLEDANKTEVSKKDRASKSKLAEIKIFLAKELEGISELPVSNDVEITASSQEIPVVERKESEPDSLSLSSEEEGFSKLESDDSARISSDSNSNSPFEEINEESHEIRTPVIETVEPEATVSASEMPSMVTGEKSDNPNDEKDNSTVSNTVNQGKLPIPGSQRGTAHNNENFTIPSQSSSLDFASESLNTVISIDNNREEQDSNQSAGHVEQIANEDTQSGLAIAAAAVLAVGVVSVVAKAKLDNINDEKDNSAASNSVNQDTSAQSPVHDSQRGTGLFIRNDEDFTVPSQSSSLDFANESLNTVIDKKEQVSNKPAGCEEQMVNEDTQPEPVVPIADEQGSKSNQKITIPQNTKKYVVAASALAIAGIALGITVAVYLEMLAIGIAVAACCLIAATVTYCYRPKSSLEDNEVEKVDDTQKSTPCCG